ncbi:MAG: hypothetical protein GYB35_16390 [Algicola sp.]|nr:hypothetical protein [Algicola sp.]
MKVFISLIVFFLGICTTASCQEERSVENSFTSLNDTIIIKTKKVKGRGLFGLGYGFLQFKDTSENFTNTIKYPQQIKEIKRLQLKVDFNEHKDYNVELLLGNKEGVQVFIVDGNGNKDLTDDTIRKLENINWSSPPQIVKCEYLISNGQDIVKDSSWLCIGSSKGNILLGKREHLIGRFKLDDEDYQIGVVDINNPVSFTYEVSTKIAITNYLGKEIDSIAERNLLSLNEVLNLNGKYYRFEKITRYGDSIVLIKDKQFETRIGTQIGVMAPEFKVITTSKDTLNSSEVFKKRTIIANSCGCGGDKQSTEAFYKMEKIYGNDINMLHVDSNIEKSDIGIHIDSEDKFNRTFYENYRKTYCSRICYVIDNKKIIDKFYIRHWESALSNIVDH